MATPDFIKALRADIGHRLLYLPAASAVVLDDEQRVLLVRRADNGRWSHVGGIAEPGEQPAVTAVREVAEETGVDCVAERVLSVRTLAPVTFGNGDRCQFVDTAFRCRAVGGRAHVADDESLEVGWFDQDALPALSDSDVHRLKLATEDGPTWFEPAPRAHDAR